MQNPYLQQLRYKLQKRVRRLNGADSSTFLVRVRELWAFFDGQPILTALAEEITARCPEYLMWIEKRMTGETELESAAIGYGVLRQYAKGNDPVAFLNFNPRLGLDQALDTFRDLYVEPLYEYLDERIDDQSGCAT